MIYVWAAPRAAASDSLAQELRCSPIMIYMHASLLPSSSCPPPVVRRVTAALALVSLGAANTPERDTILIPMARPGRYCPQKLLCRRTECPSNPPVLPLSPGSGDNLFNSRWAQGWFDFQRRAEGDYLSWGTHSVKPARGGEGGERVAPRENLCIAEQTQTWARKR